MNAAEAARRGARVVFADLNPAVVAEAEKNMPHEVLPNVTFAVDDITASKLAAGGFDVVLCNSTLEHIREDRKALREMHRLLKRGGRLYLSVPSDTVPMPAIGTVYWMVKRFQFLPPVRKLIDAYELDVGNPVSFDLDYRRKVWVALREYSLAGTTKDLESIGFEVQKATQLEKYFGDLANHIASFCGKQGALLYLAYPFCCLLAALDVLQPKTPGATAAFLAIKK